MTTLVIDIKDGFERPIEGVLNISIESVYQDVSNGFLLLPSAKSFDVSLGRFTVEVKANLRYTFELIGNKPARSIWKLVAAIPELPIVNLVDLVPLEITDEELAFNLAVITERLKLEPSLKGDQGIKGDKGDPGLPGAQGIKGDKGDQGIQGIQGLKGDTGATGAKGDKGDRGLQGLPGDPLTVDNIAYGSSWQGNLKATSKDSLYNVIETLQPKTVAQQNYDWLYGDTTSRLAVVSTKIDTDIAANNITQQTQVDNKITNNNSVLVYPTIDQKIADQHTNIVLPLVAPFATRTYVDQKESAIYNEIGRIKPSASKPSTTLLYTNNTAIAANTWVDMFNAPIFVKTTGNDGVLLNSIIQLTQTTADVNMLFRVVGGNLNVGTDAKWVLNNQTATFNISQILFQNLPMGTHTLTAQIQSPVALPTGITLQNRAIRAMLVF